MEGKLFVSIESRLVLTLFSGEREARCWEFGIWDICSFIPPKEEKKIED